MSEHKPPPVTLSTQAIAACMKAGLDNSTFMGLFAELNNHTARTRSYHETLEVLLDWCEENSITSTQLANLSDLLENVDPGRGVAYHLDMDFLTGNLIDRERKRHATQRRL